MSIKKRTACVFFALITLIFGIYFTGVKADSVNVAFSSRDGIAVATIQAVSSVGGNDAVIRRNRGPVSFESISVSKPRHIQNRITLGIREYLVTCTSLFVLISLLKGFNEVVEIAITGPFHRIILFIHNKDGSKSVFA